MKGPLKLKQELREKGISVTIIEESLSSYQESEQVEQIVKWLEKQQSRKGNESKSAYKQKLAQRLLGKGFNHSVIEQAMVAVSFEESEEEEWLAICFQGEKVRRKYEKKYNDWEFKQRVKEALYRKGFSLTLIDKYIEEECHK